MTKTTPARGSNLCQRASTDASLLRGARCSRPLAAASRLVQRAAPLVSGGRGSVALDEPRQQAGGGERRPQLRANICSWPRLDRRARHFRARSRFLASRSTRRSSSSPHSRPRQHDRRTATLALIAIFKARRRPELERPFRRLLTTVYAGNG